MTDRRRNTPRRALALSLILLAAHAAAANPRPARSQDTVKGAFEGIVTVAGTRAPIRGATIIVTSVERGGEYFRLTDAQGYYYHGQLDPALYVITASAPGFRSQQVEQLLKLARSYQVVPVPFELEPAPPGAPAAVGPPLSLPAGAAAGRDPTAEVNTKDARREGAFTPDEVSSLPLGSSTLARSPDELALLLPGVAPPPQTLGSVAGPGVGAGVGSAGQFSVNGLRSRGNNFTVDGSDNNDEDIGVRRQGFVALTPQPVESIGEYHVITLLAPAQFGRNIGAQVNVVTRSGGNDTHGALYGIFSASPLAARDPFDTANGDATVPLRAGGKGVLFAGRPVTVTNQSGGEDSFTNAQGGLVIGGPLVPNEPGGRGGLFYFFAAEGQRSSAAREASFAVPTVEQRGLFGSGATGLAADPFSGASLLAFPTTVGGDAIFSLFPFPNNPAGVYGPNTFTRGLPAGGEGKNLSGKVDADFRVAGRAQSFTARYNFLDDWRDVPVTGGALFSTLRPRVRAQNISTYLSGELTPAGAPAPVFNQLRASYGRTRLAFDEHRDTSHLVPSARGAALPPGDSAFLLNARLIVNATVPSSTQVRYLGFFNRTVEDLLGPVGQVNIAGFSPVGVDVFNFPQRRVNNTYQVADTVTARRGTHDLAFGADLRRTELNSDLPRNSRPLITFNGAPRLVTDAQGGAPQLRGFFSPVDLAAASAPSGFFQAVTREAGASAINLRYHQLNFFAQDEWRVRPNLSLSLGLRYEYNTPPREVNRRIEATFDSPALALAPGLRRFLDGRTSIFSPDRDNFAPRISIAYAPERFGTSRLTVLRGGFGIFYDQAIGAVVSQSRNVFPNALTLNLAGERQTALGPFFDIADPTDPFYPCRDGGSTTFVPVTQPGTLNLLNPAASLACLVEINSSYPGGFGVTLPERGLETPAAYHFTAGFERQLGPGVAVSAAYVGTRGRHLLRLTTPNLGPGALLIPTRVQVFSDQPFISGLLLGPGQRLGSDGTLTSGRPTAGAGVVHIYAAAASSRYDSLQLQLRGRLRDSLLYQVAYTLSRATDDASDVFDLAGAPALPQNSLTLAGERGPANFDARHRLTYSFVYDLPSPAMRSPFLRLLLGALQLAGTGRIQTGQPFTVNSIHDVNLDGNLTDRLDSTVGLVETGDRRRPLRLVTPDPLSLLAPVGRDGRVGRNTFRAGGIVDLDLSLRKNFPLSTRQHIALRIDVFNFINRANYGIPARFLEAPGFGQAVNTVTPARRAQLSLKYNF